MLLKAGFSYRSAKGSHSRWFHELLPDEPITIAGKDGGDAKQYLEKQVMQRLEKLRLVQNQESEE